MTIVLYGITHCETVKRARKWLNAQGVEYAFHDFKQAGVSLAKLRDWLDEVSLDLLLNRRGATWRALPDDAKSAAAMQAHALALMVEKPALIRRPVLTANGQVKYIGFAEAAYAAIF